jgi:hypothetical protein
MPIASEKRAFYMDFYTFKDKIYEFCDKNAQEYPTNDDIKYFYTKYHITYELIKTKKEAQGMKRFVRFSSKQRLLYREQLAELGIELTPTQVNYYIYMICIIIKEKYNIE